MMGLRSVQRDLNLASCSFSLAKGRTVREASGSEGLRSDEGAAL